MEPTMNCPVCAATLTPVKAGAITVDVCLGGCGGIWFDNFEIKKFDQPWESEGEMLVTLKKREDLAIDYDQRRTCPHCPGIVMMRHFYSPRRRVEVDECPSCGGMWLDAGELALIREEHASEVEQQRAVQEYLDGAAESLLGPMRSQGTDDAARARRVDQLFRFTKPIRYQHKPS
jgi:uncharacterized protein